MKLQPYLTSPKQYAPSTFSELFCKVGGIKNGGFSLFTSNITYEARR